MALQIKPLPTSENHTILMATNQVQPPVQALVEYYRLPEDAFAGAVTVAESAHTRPGFFHFGPDNICYGECASGAAELLQNSVRYDAANGIHRNGHSFQLPFDFAEVIDNIRRERYRGAVAPEREILASSEVIRKSYYLVRNWLPVTVRRQLQRAYFSDWRKLPFPGWPVDTTVDNVHKELLRRLMEVRGVQQLPFIWFWPEGAPNCLIMTHDVETSSGRDFTSQLMDLDDRYGIKASIQAIPEKRYELPHDYVREIRGRGFEFNIHDLNHDGHLYREREEFLERAARINHYVRQFDAKGFRSGAMYRNLEWYDAFEFSYDMSVPNVAHLEPLRGGCCTVMPFFVGNIVELPLTTAQDYSLFQILREYDLNLWNQQLELLRRNNGLMSFLAHPDYLIEPRARRVYESLLDRLRKMADSERMWCALPGEVDAWWRERSRMELVNHAGEWRIVGSGAERACIAYARLEGDSVKFDVQTAERVYGRD
jgi:hypothetical protein